MEEIFFLNDAMIETGLWREPDCSTDSALEFPGPWLLVYPLCLACGCHRELQAPSGARAAGGCSAARHVAREEISGLNFTSHGRVWEPCVPVGVLSVVSRVVWCRGSWAASRGTVAMEPRPVLEVCNANSHLASPGVLP